MLKIAIVKGKNFETLCNNWFKEHSKAEIIKVDFAVFSESVPGAFILYNEADSDAHRDTAKKSGGWLEYLMRVQQDRMSSESAVDVITDDVVNEETGDA